MVSLLLYDTKLFSTFLSCHILQLLMLRSIHLLLWVVTDLCHLLIGGQFIIHWNNQVFCTVACFYLLLAIWLILFSYFSEINCTLFCCEWRTKMGASGSTSYQLECINLFYHIFTTSICLKVKGGVSSWCACMCPNKCVMHVLRVQWLQS